MDVSTGPLGSPAARLGAYGLILAASLGGGAAVGAAFGPEPSTAPTHGGDHAGSAADPDGLARADRGYRLELATPVIDAADEAPLRFVIHGPDGGPVTSYEVAHDKELHLVIVGRDLRSYAHLHPTRDAAGTWTVVAPPLPAGPHRMYADFVPTGGDGLTLATDLGVAGEYEPRSVPAPATGVAVDGYDVSFDGELVAGEVSELAVTVTRDGEAVSDLQPYLGALGHLVAIRDGDLAYLHVHPLGAGDDPGGPTVRFAVDVPTAGTYGLFFDFSHRDVVRTAAVTTTVAVSADPDHEVHGE